MPSETRLHTQIDELAKLATGRRDDLFQPDIDRNRETIRTRFGGQRVLVLGGAGSIGSSTAAALSAFAPAAVHVVDRDENALAELVRDLRSRPEGLPVADFRAMPLDLGSPLMRRFLREQAPYDWVLNFAALKHVQSEKDVCSILQMFETNLLKPANLWTWLCDRGRPPSYFSVSTDKAAAPANLMGASKRLMEHLMFGRDGAFTSAARCTTARFANVAFSNGSLLESFRRRLEKRQPLAAPRATRRFFISPRESGQICLLAAACCPDRHILIPRLDPMDDTRELEVVARSFLQAHGLEARVYADEETARANVARDLDGGMYPLLLTQLDTEGEKTTETFAGPEETVVEIGMSKALAVRYAPVGDGVLPEFLATITDLIAATDEVVDKQRLVEAVARVMPEFHHAGQREQLDRRM